MFTLRLLFLIMTPFKVSILIVLTLFPLLARASPAQWVWMNHSSVSPPPAIYGIDCPTTTSCIAVGSGGTVLTSEDNGQIWQQRDSSITETLLDVDCPTTTFCIAVGEYGVIYTTADWGNSWQIPDYKALPYDLAAIDCPTTETCIAVGSGGLLLRSTDQGLSWFRLDANTPGNLYDIHCPTTNTCVAVGQNLSGRGIIITTNNGGTLWNLPQDTGDYWHYGVECIDATMCFAVGPSGLMTTHNGSTWSALPVAVTQLNDINCPTSQQCHAVGDNGTVIISHDGGQSWQQSPTDLMAGLEALECPSADLCWATSAQGQIVQGQSSYTLTVDKVDKGYISSQPAGIDCYPDCDQTYLHATAVTLTATPEPGFGFQQWQGACEGNQNPLTVIVDTDKHCTAHFQPLSQPGYDSTPMPGSTLTLGSPLLNQPTTVNFSIQETGDLALVVSAPEITGSHAHNFKILSSQFPLTLPNGSSATSVTVQCTPSSTGLRSATLTLSTNDPTQPQVNYPLSCIGQPVAGYASHPSPGGQLDLGTQILGQVIAKSITVLEAGQSHLQIDFVAIQGPHQDDFKVLSPSFPFIIADGGDSEQIRVSCTPSAVGPRTATLILSSNDPHQLEPSYTLTCEGLPQPMPIYSSTPAADTPIDLGEQLIGTRSEENLLTLVNPGERALQVDHIMITGEQSDDFILNAPQTPMSIKSQQAPISIGIACQPSAAGVRHATLEINSLELEMTALYPLTCKGLAQTPAFASTPSAGSTIDFGTLLIGDTATQALTLTETADAPLWINLAEFNGSEAFQIQSSAFPMTLAAQAHDTLRLTCTPSSATTQTATLILNTNDPHHSSITYTLTCTGKTQAAHYDSIPAPQTPLEVGDSELGKPTTVHLTVLASQVGQLTVSAAQIKGEHAQEFSLINTPLPFTLAPQDQAYRITIQCISTQLEQRRAQLILTTNDPTQPTVAYPLNCTGLPQPLQATFSGEIQTQDGVIGHQLTIDAPEYFQLTGHIQPDRRHVGQLADITVTYHWQPTARGQALTVAVPIAHQYVLTEHVDLDLFYGTLPTATGIFDVTLGYQVGEEALSAPIATLTVLPNKTPVDIHLSANHVTEASAEETLVGILSTTDADKHERIVYGLINDAQGRFKIVNNELRVAQGGLLDFEYASQMPITVRAVDAAGSYKDKNFIIQINDKQTKPQDILLTSEHVFENSPADIVVGKLITPDPESKHYVYQLVDNAEGRFKLMNDLLLINKNSHLDFETASEHSITVRSTQVETQQQLEKTFTLEVTNLTDVAIEHPVIHNSAGQLIASTRIKASEEVTLSLELVPDAQHVGRTAELIAVTFSNPTAVQMLSGPHWHLWDGHFAHLKAVQQLTLQPRHHLTLWQGRFNQFMSEQVEIFVGYRLPNGDVIYQPEPVNIQVQE